MLDGNKYGSPNLEDCNQLTTAAKQTVGTAMGYIMLAYRVETCRCAYHRQRLDEGRAMPVSAQPVALHPYSTAAEHGLEPVKGCNMLADTVALCMSVYYLASDDVGWQ